MHNSITVTGVVATIPRNITTSQGIPVTSFRFASSQRRFDRTNQCWVDGDTNWYTVTSFRRLAENSHMSITKGDRLIVMGRVRIRDWETPERSGTSIEIDADSMGHDLMWGTSLFTKTVGWNAVASTTETEHGVYLKNDLGFDPNENEEELSSSTQDFVFNPD
jgi:single-strand DNA-binding protein